MSGKDRRKYLTATTLDQAFLDWSHDNLECRLEMICDIETPTGTIYASDRNKYVGGIFYEALLVFPVISRTVGEWLAPDIQFSTLTIEVSNADSRFNNILPGGSDYDSWVGRAVTVKMGLAEQALTYTTIFKGTITDVGGMKRSVKSITLIARDDYDRISVSFPNTALSKATYTDLEDANIGLILPVIYGDFTVALGDKPAIVPSYVFNGLAAIASALTNVKLIIAANDLTVFLSSEVYLKRSDLYLQVPLTEVVNVGGGNRTFEVKQESGTLWIPDEGGPDVQYRYVQGDLFYVRVKGKDLGAYDDNLIMQARDILITYGGLFSGDLHSNWLDYRDKNTPAQSSITTIKSRVWIQEPTPVIQYVLSMLEQVRLEAFIDRNQEVKLNSLHFEDFDPTPTFTIKNWDVVKGTFQPQLDERNNFNRAQASYNFHPDQNENAFSTSVYKNQGSITQIGKAISKRIVFPNLYVEADVIYQLIEIIRMASSLFEIVVTKATWRSLLKDIGDFVSIDNTIGSTQFDSVPALIRDVGYDPDGMTIDLKLWSFMMCPFPGYVPGFSGTVGGYNATITEEV